MFRYAFTSMRCLCYPPQPDDAAPGQIGTSAHTDGDAFTLLLQDDAAASNCDANGEWMRAEVIPGTIVVNLGDVLARWTNDRYRSTPHRVMNASGRRAFGCVLL